MTYDEITSRERTLAGALALVMHLLFFVLLVFGVSWQKKHADSAAIVDLWSDLPPLPQPRIEPPAAVKPPEPPRPEPKVEPKMVPPKPEPKPAVKPDIALREKLEKERKQKEQEKIEQERKRKEQERLEAKKLEAKKREEEKARLAALKDQEDALRKLAQQQAAQAAAQARLVDEYRRRISDKIRRFIVEPPGLQGNPEVEFEVVLLPGGEVLSIRLRKSSAVTAYDSAVERAILKAQPLPLPPDPAMFSDFRELRLKFRPKE
ncbi:MAG: TonB family protein [Burkholderiales bacterium]